MTAPGLVSTALDPYALAARVEAHDTRIQAEVVQPWAYRTCDLCTLLECPGDVHVSWSSAVDRQDHEAWINRSHLDAWVSGLLLSDLGDPDWYRLPVLVRIGGAA